MTDKTRFIIRELSGLINLKVRNKRMTPEDHKQQVQRLKDGLLAKALADVYNCAERLSRLTEYAFSRATRSQNAYIQGRLSEASLKIKELREILDDPQIRALVDPQNELPDFMKEALKRQKES